MSTYNEECLQMEELIRIMGKLGTTDEIVQVLSNAFSLLQPLTRVFWNMRQYPLHKAFDRVRGWVDGLLAH
jgi:hypothetical protein